MVYHVINRGVGKRQLFFSDEDYLAFERVIVETLEKQPMRVLSYSLMPNNWHFVLWPKKDEDLGRFMQRLTVTHVTRWQRNYNMVGFGHVYQGRFKSFPVQTDEHFHQVVRYVERNALRTNLVTQAGAWPWCSLWIQQYGSATCSPIGHSLVHEDGSNTSTNQPARRSSRPFAGVVCEEPPTAARLG